MAKTQQVERHRKLVAWLGFVEAEKDYTDARLVAFRQLIEPRIFGAVLLPRHMGCFPSEERAAALTGVDLDHLRRKMIAFVPELCDLLFVPNEQPLLEEGRPLPKGDWIAQVAVDEWLQSEMHAHHQRGRRILAATTKLDARRLAGGVDDSGGGAVVKHIRRVGFAFAAGQALYGGKDLDLPTGRPIEVLKKLVESEGIAVAYPDLDSQSTAAEASEPLRTAVHHIRAALRKKHVPYAVVTKPKYGYLLR